MPKPIADQDTAPFWDGCRAGRLFVPRCAVCMTVRWPPGPMCPHCQSQETHWIEATGAGRVYSWTVVTHPVDAILREQVPYIVALVELSEGVRIIANIIDCDAAEMVAAMDVTLVFEDQEGLNIPNFKPRRLQPPATATATGKR